MAALDDRPLYVATELVPDHHLDDKEVHELDADIKQASAGDHIETVEDGPKAEGGNALQSAYSYWTRRQVTRKFWRIYMFGLLCSCAGTFAGYIDGAPGSVVANQSFINQFGTVKDPKTGLLALNADYVSLWGVAQQISPLTPNLLSPYIADRWGRRVVCWLYLGFAVVTIIAETLARDWKTWFCARFFAGWTFGFLQPGPIALMSELVMPQMRGNVVAVFALQWSIGGMFCAIGLQVLNKVAPMHYLNIIYSEWLLVFLFAICCIVVPESPPWLIKKGRIEKAKKEYRKLVGNPSDFDFEHEFSCIVQDVEVSQRLVAAQSRSEWRAVLKWRNFRRCLIVVLPYAGQSLCGGTYLGSYTTYFFSQAGMKNAFLGNMIVSITASLGILTSIFLYDRIGRRPILVVCTALLAMFNLIIGGLAFIPMTGAVGAGLITTTSLWQFTNGMSMTSIGWSSQAELTSPLLRAKSGGLIAFIHGASKIIWNYAVPQMISAQKAGWGAKTGLFFGGLTALWFIPIYFFYPETMGRNFAALDDLFARKIDERRFHLTATPYDSPEFIDNIGKRQSFWRVLWGGSGSSKA